ncbi:Lipid A phosphoethanolamine transferase, putative [Pectobacterium sp. F1-1]|nr:MULTISPECIES: sulfatase-like hydrolase/transferase [Pectobacterium]UYA60455.1 Lipid A phosphoethanolamine transferase, putative [Pectobacterium sp. F1-1]
MIYLSDHGELLGERGIYLHGTPYLIASKERMQVPMVMWFSPVFVQDAGFNLTCLRNNAENKDYSHDNFTIPGLACLLFKAGCTNPNWMCSRHVAS